MKLITLSDKNNSLLLETRSIMNIACNILMFINTQNIILYEKN